MPYNVEVYTVLKNDEIVAVVHTAEGIEGVQKSIINQKWEHDDIIQVPIDFEGKKKQNIKEYDSSFKLKKLSERVKDGYVTIPDNHKLDDSGENFRPMTKQERVEAGLETIDPMFKVVGDDVILKSEEELIADGIKTRKQIDDEKQIREDEKLIQAEMRKMVIASLGNKLKIVKE